MHGLKPINHSFSWLETHPYIKKDAIKKIPTKIPSNNFINPSKLTQIPGLRCPTNENDAIRGPETQAQQPHVSIDRWGPLDR